MRTKKKLPPPDHPGNIQGRMSALRSDARKNASVTKKQAKEDGKDTFGILNRQLKAIEPQMKKLEKRLEKCLKSAPSPEGTPAKKTRKSKGAK